MRLGVAKRWRWSLGEGREGRGEGGSEKAVSH